MCGIAGLIGQADEALLRRLCRAMKHRGPDDEGFVVDASGPAGLGMVRLSIVDVASGHQPMTDECKRYDLVFNGEIYNHQALRAELEAKGHRFASRADTEVIVHLYEEQGAACVTRLNGDFAFAIWDRAERRLFIARDRLGVKPLYYWHAGERLAFASELKALMQLPDVPKALDPVAIDSYLRFLYIAAPRTVFQAVKKLPPACHLTFVRGRVAIERYWTPGADRSAERLTDAELEREILARLEASVRLRLMSDVPLGAFLSGGIDSSAVVALMSRAGTQPVQTFSLGFERPYDAYSELPAAAAAARAFRTAHHEVLVRPDLVADLPRVVHHLDEPLADSSALLTFLISREAKRAVTVALTGIGGDELFGGYPRYLGMRLASAARHVPAVLRRPAAGLAHLVPEQSSSRNLGGWVKRFAGALHLPEDERYLSWISQGDPSALYTAEFRKTAGTGEAMTAYRTALGGMPGDAADRAAALDLQFYLPDDLLMLGDKMGMAHGLEIRVPFCDHALVELACGVPMRRRLAGYRLKALFRRAVRRLLPPDLLARPKRGFMLPIGAWLRDELQPWCRDVLAPEHLARRGLFEPAAVRRLLDAHMSGRANAAHQLYALVVFELWCRDYLDGARRRA
jgi:asparagine synthase (glutamine-hydrolysing)